MKCEILVLGVTGMLGHKMFQTLSGRFGDRVYGASRDLVTSPRFDRVALLRNTRIMQGVNAEPWESLLLLLRQMRPAVIVNCIGVIKQRDAAQSAIPSLLMNSLLPHRLAHAASAWGGRLIHFSTDCVFSGRKGMYREEDISDAQDLYGRSKFLGEVTDSNALTLRTSIIGRELAEFRSLLEWFLSKRGGTVQGYRKALYSGVTTNYLSEVVARIIESHGDLRGLYQIAGEPVSKYHLLTLIRDVFNLNIEIQPVEAGEVCDRTMQGGRFVQATGIPAPEWPELIHGIYSDPTPYEQWRAGPSCDAGASACPRG